jgi:hypothetical protein
MNVTLFEGENEMDYLFYGKVQVKRSRIGDRATRISLSINCMLDESIMLYSLSPDSKGKRLCYQSLPIERLDNRIESHFQVDNGQMFIFVLEGKSNEAVMGDVEAIYAVFNGEIVALPGNGHDLINLSGITYLLDDGSRVVQ